MAYDEFQASQPASSTNCHDNQNVKERDTQKTKRNVQGNAPKVSRLARKFKSQIATTADQTKFPLQDGKTMPNNGAASASAVDELNIFGWLYFRQFPSTPTANRLLFKRRILHPLDKILGALKN